ncbi:hypothetical protein PKO111_128 [Klebsiella phage PKO111]|uniref:Putative regulatory protein FmdB zinc ribbon domain-containing protein n=1 Tax=Klebsiella phage PKO111 TaxID=1654928 RepID=A0A159B7W3_9CAUD|nr:FmdB-like transcriptional regulator [Klebsiella phage PKO111]AKJ73192.1 hypothetical protein PKO111_128 [Klebsiella phage PKO111]
MPTYDYKCTKCGDEFEKMRKISERDEPLNCTNEKCKGVGFAKRVVSAPAVHYDGLKNGDY